MATFSWSGVTGNWGVAGNWQPSGIPNAPADDAFITTPGAYAVTIESAASYALNLLSLGNAAGTVDVQGTLSFAGTQNTLDLAAGTLLLDANGVLAGATIIASGGSFVAAGGTLNGATYRGDLVLGDDAQITLTGGLVAEDSTGGLPGTIELAGTGAALTIGDAETLDNLALDVAGYLSSITASTGTLTFGASATVALSSGFGLLTADVVNLGSIQVSSGFASVFNLAADSFFNNQGSISIAGGTLDILVTDFTNAGGIDIGSGGDLLIGVQATLVNSGGITVEAGGTLTLGGSLTLAGLQAGSITGKGGTISIEGTLDLQGGTLDLTAGGPFANLAISADSGIIANGTILTNGGTLTGQDGTLVNVTVLGPFELPSGAVLHTSGDFTIADTAVGTPGTLILDGIANLQIDGGLTLGTAGNPGTIVMPTDDSTLNFAKGGTLAHAVLDLQGDSDIVMAPGSALFLASDVVADLTGSDVEFQGNVVSLGSIAVNAGTTSAEDLATNDSFINLASIAIGAASLFADTDIFTNAGQIDIGDGGLFSVSASTRFGNSGTVTIEAGGTLARLDATTLADLTSGGIVNNGGTLLLSGSLDLQGGTMALSPANMFSHVDLTGDGTIGNGTIVPAGGQFHMLGGTFAAIVYQGELALADNAILSTAGGLTVTDDTGAGPGTIDIGFGADLSIAGGVALGTGGVIQMISQFATLEFQDSALLDQLTFTLSGDTDQLFVRSGTLTIGADAQANLSSVFGFGFGNLVNQGSINQTAGFFDLLNQNAGDTFDNRGLLRVDAAAFEIDDDNFSNEGTVAIAGGGQFTISASTTLASTGLIQLGGGGTLDIAPATSAGVTFNGVGLLLLDSPNDYTGTLGGLVDDDVIQLTGQTITSAAITGTTLVAGLDGGGSIDIAVAPGFAGTQFLVQAGTDGNLDQLKVIPCFRAGTRILTERGAIAVEHIVEGDRVITASGRVRPVRWIGWRDVDCARHPHPERVRPYRVQAHAFGVGQPNCDLFLSPDHAIFADGVLIPIKHLDNGSTIRQVGVRRVSYYHLELDAHDIVLAEGLAAESYLDIGDRASFANGGAYLQLHPEFGVPAGNATLVHEALYYAPLVVAGAAIERVRQMLDQRAKTVASMARTRFRFRA